MYLLTLDDVHFTDNDVKNKLGYFLKKCLESHAFVQREKRVKNILFDWRCAFVSSVSWQPALLSGSPTIPQRCRQGKIPSEESNFTNQPHVKDGNSCSLPLQQCAVEFEIKAYSAESQDAKVRKRWVAANQSQRYSWERWVLQCSSSSNWFGETLNYVFCSSHTHKQIYVFYYFALETVEMLILDTLNSAVEENWSGSSSVLVGAVWLFLTVK